jgi:cytochrome c-type biogenesis protein CcmH/NrfG
VAVIETSAGRTDAAGTALERAAALQPQNPTPWLRLADFQLSAQQDPQAALRSLGPAIALDPRNTTAVELFLEARRQGAATP